MIWMPWRTHCLTEPEERACAASTLLRQLGLLHRHRDLFFRHRRLFGAHAGDLLAREVELDGVDAVFDELRTVRRTSSGPETTMPRLSPRAECATAPESPEAADRGDLRTRRQVARAGEAPFVDEALARRRRAAAWRPPRRARR